MDNFKNILEKYFDVPFYFKIMGFAVIWLIIAAILYFTIISSQLQKIDKKNMELAKLKKQTLEIVKVKKKLKNFEKELKQLEKDFKIALKKLPDSKEIPKLLFDISDYGKKYNLDFLFFKPGKVEKKEFFGTIPIKVKISGTYHNIGQFLYDIANMARIVKVLDFSLTPRKGGVLVLDGNLETYVFLKENLNAKKNKHKKKKKK